MQAAGRKLAVAGSTGRVARHLVAALELMALRRLTAAAFGTLMSIEPAIAVVVGFIALGQAPGAAATVGIALVVTAGIGAQRTGARVEAHPELPPLDHQDARPRRARDELLPCIEPTP